MKNRAGFLLEVRRWTFDVERSVIPLPPDFFICQFFFVFFVVSSVSPFSMEGINEL
jgi:hypothetical protein